MNSPSSNNPPATPTDSGLTLDSRAPPLFGACNETGFVAAELLQKKDNPADEVMLFFRTDDRLEVRSEPLRCFLLATAQAVAELPGAGRTTRLAGSGALDTLIEFGHWNDCLAAKTWLGRHTGKTAGAPDAPYLFLNDPLHQHLLLTGRTSFLGMAFEQLRRMQVDIECITTPGYEFCNADRPGDSIVAIACTNNHGFSEVLRADLMPEPELLQRFVRLVVERDPDVIEGHNIFNFDLAYIRQRCALHNIPLAIGRNGAAPTWRPSQFSAGERTISYQRCEVFGRHIVDTLFLCHFYDISHRSLPGLGLKEVATHFGLAPSNRTYVDGSQIGRTFATEPDLLMRYVLDDARETRALSDLLSRGNFAQAQLLPYTYQNVCVRGNATKIDALLLREYLRTGQSVPLPGRPRPFEGGYTDLFTRGVVSNVHHCDARSLYPSLMLARHLAPARDELGVFLRMLERLRTFRIEARKKAVACDNPALRAHYDALQSTFKVLINSFYGYLGFAQGRFNDYNAAEEVAAGGREILRAMLAWLREHGAIPVEIDTDGIYFVPPTFPTPDGMETFRTQFAAALPAGIEVEFDGEFPAMFSYKMKNYALLTSRGEIIIKGAALKSRGLEPFQRNFMREAIRLMLDGRPNDLATLYASYEKAIRDRQWPIALFAKTETLQDSPQTYLTKRASNKRARSAAYELAVASNRDYRAGDQLSYYITGSRKTVKVHEAARLLSDWNPANRDDNVAYYLDKLKSLYAKFTDIADNNQTEFDLGFGGPADNQPENTED